MPLIRWFAPAFVLVAAALAAACAGEAPPEHTQAAAQQRPDLHDRLDARARRQSEYERTS